MTLRLEPVRVATGLDEEGMLVFLGDRLVAVLVQLSETHEDLGVAGHWHLEAGFGLRLTGRERPFPDLDAAQSWISQHLARRS
jgi:hypothetical protein